MDYNTAMERARRAEAAGEWWQARSDYALALRDVPDDPRWQVEAMEGIIRNAEAGNPTRSEMDELRGRLAVMKVAAAAPEASRGEASISPSAQQ